MTHQVDIREASLADVKYVAENLRHADRREVSSLHPKDFVEVILLGAKRSDRCFAAYSEGIPVCVWGIVQKNVLPREGVPWLLSTHGIYSIERQFVRLSKRRLNELSEGYEVLRNIVDSRNRMSIRWLKWLGFTFLKPIPLGPFNVTFIPFEMVRNV